MDMTTINIPVNEDAARLYNDASEDERRKIQLLLNFWLGEIAASRHIPLNELMDNISDKAQERGLMPEILDSILNDDE
jgi:predicted DNA-binding ribbon-helix-helix protein